ncbi:MAG: lysophospholipid acyltransferase family protein, partial [Planctomycetes bacterium]|nr:lysophospholipid acyltransferase family protein [Planctomycetota bacterium]
SRAAREFLRQALGELPARERERLVRRGWLQLLRVTVDTERLVRVPRARLRQHFEVRLSADARRVLDERRGCVLVSGHVGNWEAAFAVLPALGFHPAYGVAKPPKNKFLAQALQASREGWGVRVLSRKGAMADAPAILKAGGTLGLVVDQRTSGRALLVPFFGRLARCERAPAVLLKRQRVPVVLLACRMGAAPLSYEFELSEVLWPEEWARREVEEIVLRINQGLERMIRADPDQYVWIHDRYRDTPRTLESSATARLRRGEVPGSPQAE